MSNTNEKKIRNIDHKLANLKQEKKYYREMINNIKKENFYLRNQRNKKIMVNITKSVLPYVISFEIIVFSVKINGYGYPIIQDKIINYKSYCFDMDYIDYRLRNAIKENVINKDLYDYIDLNDALEFVDIIFNNNRDKIYFLKQYLKDLSETRNNNILIRSEKII